MTHPLTYHRSQTALLPNISSITTQKIKSLCCAAAGITALYRGATEVLEPHEKLREAATTDTTLIAQDRPLAQPAQGYNRFRLEAK